MTYSMAATIIRVNYFSYDFTLSSPSFATDVNVIVIMLYFNR